MEKRSPSLVTVLFTVIILLILITLTGKALRFREGNSIFGKLLLGGANSLGSPPTPTPVFLVLPTPPITSKPAITPKPRR